MAEAIDWLDDGTAGGTPFSPRFGDRYRSELGGLEQARDVFLKGCGLPALWAGQQQWRILETGFGLGLNFLVTWQAWKDDPLRPRMLHFVSTEAWPASAEDVLRSATTHPALVPLAEQLCAQLWGLLPGTHRLAFEDGRLLLTLCIGDTKAVLQQHNLQVDSVYLDGFSPQKNPDIWDLHTLQAVSRCCRRGTRIATWTIARHVRDGLAQCGFIVRKTPGIPPKRDNLQGEYNPPWEPRRSSDRPLAAVRAPSTCVVIGAGLCGAATAASLARRGWQVLVLDAADAPAAGASGLPAGLLAPHVSPDDSPLSRLSRAGMRITLQQAQARLQAGSDWAQTGVLEHGVDGHGRQLPAGWQDDWAQAAADWSCAATPLQLQACGLGQESTGLWHARAGWVRPAALVRAWLDTPGVSWQGRAEAARLVSRPSGWEVHGPSGQVLARADMVVLAAAHLSAGLASGVQDGAGHSLPSTAPALQPIRGQVSFAHGAPQGLPSWPVNGHGSLMPAASFSGGTGWLAGATFERDSCDTDVREKDHLENQVRLEKLLPQAADRLAADFSNGAVQGWAGVRCATPTRLPALGPVAHDVDNAGGDVWICSGMGSRGLTFAALCAELLAAALHGEPMPVEWRLAQSLVPKKQPQG
jgi:tRNA 5-methylaminomethyl-2-thiouridine biosynthesis bifunctional protein